MHCLVAGESRVLSGGMLRFVRLANQLAARGVEFSSLWLAADKTMESETQWLRQVLPAGPEPTAWDVTMVPGAGFRAETIQQFAQLTHPRYGLRVQHVLNDQSRYPAFKAVNEAFQPHLILFNNDDWPLDSRCRLKAESYHRLVGAVDTDVFRPSLAGVATRLAGAYDRWVIGGQASKNPLPLLEALPYLPDKVVIRLFGKDPLGLAEKYAHWVTAGRLELIGPLLGDVEQLAPYYQTLDCVVMTETFAGWSNLVAEAMASGVPVVCTQHGTRAMAVHNQTVLLLETPNKENIVNSVDRLLGSPALCEKLSYAARKAIEPFSWAHYARDFLHIVTKASDTIRNH